MSAPGPELNWKGRLVDSGLNWKGRLLQRTYFLRHPLRWFDWRMGLDHIHTGNLNWKGRLIERVGLMMYPVLWFDQRLGLQHIHTEGLNWKGRMIERIFAIIPRHPVLLLDQRLGLQHIHNGELNWKGRSVERSVAIGIAITRHLAGMVSLLINLVGFSIYWTVGKLRPTKTVRSVLQLSILSHKPFMVSRSLREEGLRSDCLMVNVGMGKGILNMGWDYAMPANLPPMKRWLLEHYLLWTVLARYDVIHSHFKTLLSHTGWEMKYLKRLGKVVVFQFRGCDVRHRSLNMKLQPVLNCCQECDYPVGSCDTEYQFQQVGIAMKYGDLFFVTTPDLIDFVKGSEHLPFIRPVGVDFDAIVAAPRDDATFRVVTSSNHDGIDGTRYIRAAVARLKAEGRAIELIEVKNMPYREALAIYKSADVYVGKLRMGYYNNANIETMMLGVPNMSYIRDEFLPLVPDSPIIVTTPDTVYERLHEYIDRREDLKAIGARGPAFVRAHHEPRLIMQRLIAHYNDALRAKG